jgi:hypothetical protein
MAAVSGGFTRARPALWEKRALGDPGEASGHSSEAGLRVENWFGPHVPGVSLLRPGAAGSRRGDWLRAAPGGQAQLAARVCVVQAGTGVRLCHIDRCSVRSAVPHTSTATSRLAAAVAGWRWGRPRRGAVKSRSGGSPAAAAGRALGLGPPQRRRRAGGAVTGWAALPVLGSVPLDTLGLGAVA